MRVNLISGLDENSCLETIGTPSQVYAWFLHKAFVEEGIDARLVNTSKLMTGTLPETDHTIIVSSVAHIVSLKKGGYLQKLRTATPGKLTWYMNADKLWGDDDQYFDYCFTQIEPYSQRPEKYVCAGWGVDPTYSYPEQGEKAAFFDSKVFLASTRHKTERAYQIYDSVLPKLNIKIYNPVPTYSSKRIPYPDYQAILRKCHYFLCTQFGDGGLNRLEAAACGALLVVPAKLYRQRTMRLLNHRVWHTEEELVGILNENVDIEANRERTLKHRWKDVVRRIIMTWINDYERQ